MSDVDLNSVKAGKYELVIHSWEEITSKPGQPLDFVRHRNGDTVDLNVEDARRLVAAGAVRKPVAGDGEAAVPGREASAPPDGTESRQSPATPRAATVKEVLAEVGDDPDKAAAALHAENARGDESRATLTDKLAAILTAAGGTEGQG